MVQALEQASQQSLTPIDVTEKKPRTVQTGYGINVCTVSAACRGRGIKNYFGQGDAIFYVHGACHASANRGAPAAGNSTIFINKDAVTAATVTQGSPQQLLLGASNLFTPHRVSRTSILCKDDALLSTLESLRRDCGDTEAIAVVCTLATIGNVKTQVGYPTICCIVSHKRCGADISYLLVHCSCMPRLGLRLRLRCGPRSQEMCMPSTS